MSYDELESFEILLKILLYFICKGNGHKRNSNEKIKEYGMCVEYSSHFWQNNYSSWHNDFYKLLKLLAL